MKYDFSDFEFIDPPERQGVLPIITVTSSKKATANDLVYKFNFNTKMMQILQEKHITEFSLRVKPDGSEILIGTNSKHAMKVPRGGSMNMRTFAEKLIACGISIPAAYTMEQIEDSNLWLGVLKGKKVPVIPPASKLTPPAKPRKKGLKDMLPPEEGDPS